MSVKKHDEPYRSKDVPNPILVEHFRTCKTAGWYLDIGCNIGRELQFMGTHGYQCEGIDIDAEAIAICRTRLRAEHVTNTVALVVSAQDFLQRTPRSYDVVHCWNVLPFLTANEAGAVLEGIREKLTSGGTLFLRAFRDAVPSAKHPEDGPVHMFWLPTLHAHFRNYEVLKSCEELFDDEGHLGRPEPHQHAIVTLVLKKM